MFKFDFVEMGKRLLMARMRKLMKQSDLGIALGVTQPTYSDIESGKRDINITQLFTIAEALEVPVTWVLGIDDEKHELTYEEKIQVEEYINFLISKREK